MKKKESKARKLAKKVGVDVGMIEKHNANYYKTKKKETKLSLEVLK